MRDPGLQPERTMLAWSRTALGLLVNAVLVLRSGLDGHRWELVALGSLLLVAAALTQAFSVARRRVLARPGPSPAAPAAALLALAVVAGSCSAVALATILREIARAAA